MRISLTAALLALSTLPASAEIVITDAYARAASPMAKSGAAFMVIENTDDQDDRLISVQSDVAMKVELHTHIASDQGVMQMRHVPEGFVIPAHGQHALARGGDHVMLMGLKGALAQGDTVSVTLTFDRAGEITVEVPVDYERQDMMEMGAMDHSNMDHGSMDQGAMDQGEMDHSNH